MVERIAWAMLALIHAMPALALFRPALLTRLYGAVPGDGSFLLLQHRAALFLVVVIVALWAMADPAVRRLAVVAVGVSMLSFLWLFAMAGRPPALRTIAIADLVGMVPLLFVAWRAWAQ
jgi:hypothetical protein